LPNGAYVVTPSKSGVSFSPPSQSVTVNAGAATVGPFTATANGGGCAGTVPPAVLAGTQTLAAGVDNNSLGQAEAFQVTGAGCGTVNSLNLYVDASSTARTIVVGLYADNAGEPGALLTQGTTSSPVAGAWNKIAVPAVGVTSATPYWIAVLGTNSGTVAFRDSSGGCRSEVSAQTTLTALPATWTPGTSYTSCPLSAYAAP